MLWMVPPLLDIKVQLLVVCPFKVLLEEQFSKMSTAGFMTAPSQLWLFLSWTSYSSSFFITQPISLLIYKLLDTLCNSSVQIST